MPTKRIQHSLFKELQLQSLHSRPQVSLQGLDFWTGLAVPSMVKSMMLRLCQHTDGVAAGIACFFRDVSWNITAKKLAAQAFAKETAHVYRQNIFFVEMQLGTKIFYLVGPFLLTKTGHVMSSAVSSQGL